MIQWRRQRHLTWSPTHDAVSREINRETFRPLAGFEPVTVGTKCWCLTTRPPELTELNIGLGVVFIVPINYPLPDRHIPI